MSLEIDSATYYTATKKYFINFPELEENIDVDVVVIGGGFTGINTSLELAENGITNIAVLEAKYLGYGGTGRNGGQIMAGIGHDIEKLENSVGKEGVQKLFEISNLGSQIIQDRIKKYDIDADFRHGYAYMAFNSRQTATLQKWEKDFKSVDPHNDIYMINGQAEIHSVIGSDTYQSGLVHMGAGQVHSLNLLLGEAKALSSYGSKIYEYSPALEVTYGEKIIVRTAKGTVTAKKLLWACDSFLNKMEPSLHHKTINTFAYQMMTEPLSDEIIQKISPIRGAYSDIRPVIDYYRVTSENRLLFGSATYFIEHTPNDLRTYNRKNMLKIFPYLDQVHIDLAWGGPMACSANLFPQIGSLPNHPNVFYCQGYSGFGVTPSHIVCKVLAEGIRGEHKRYDLFARVKHKSIIGKDLLRPFLLTGAKSFHQLSGYFNGRR